MAELNTDQAQFIKEAKEELARAREEDIKHTKHMRDKTDFAIGIVLPSEKNDDAEPET